MTLVLAFDMGSPLMLLFGIVVALSLGAAGGYVVGTALGRTPPQTPLPASLRLVRDALGASGGDIEKAAGKLRLAGRGELAGEALVLARRVAESAGKLGAVERQARDEEGRP